MDEEIPWKAPAVLGWRPASNASFTPELAGLTLTEALIRAVDPDIGYHGKPCIWVNWHGREVVIQGRRILQLAAHPDRPQTAA